jgi:hypothetical protein
MSDVGRAKCSRTTRRLLVAGLLSAFLVSCGRAAPQQVAVSGLPPAVPGPAAPTSSFQGHVASVDAEAGAVVVAVKIVWTPVVRAAAEDRRVLVDAATRWEPAVVGVGGLHVGEEVQVEATDRADGSWQAVKVLLFDID